MTEQSILSVGTAIYEVLNDKLKGKVTKVFPIAADEATLPYVCYHRDGLEAVPYKDFGNYNPPFAAKVTVDCYASSYKESIQLAEAVRKALDGMYITTSEGLTVRSCWLQDALETWADDAFVQSLVFQLKC